MKTKTVLLLAAIVFFNLYSQDKSLPPNTKTYYITNGTHQICDLWEYKVSSIDSLNMLLLGNVSNGVNVIPQIDNDDEILFKYGQRYYGQINLVDVSVATGLTFCSYGYEEDGKPIIDGSFDHFELSPNQLNNGIYEYEFTDGVPSNFKVVNVSIEDKQMILAREPDLFDYDNDGILNDDFYEIATWDPESRELTTNDINLTGYGGAEFVAKECKSWYDKSVISDCTSNGCKLGAENHQIGDFQGDYGFFIQNHLQALDDNNEWYFDVAATPYPKLYLKTNPSDEGKTVYVTGCIADNIEDFGNGFYIVLQNDYANYTIEDLDFRNMQECIMINGIWGNYYQSNINILKNDFSNSVVGIDNYHNNYVNIKGNKFKNLNSFGILSYGDHIVIDDFDPANQSVFENIGLILGYDTNFYWEEGLAEYLNLVAIHTFGDYVTIQNNDIQNIGYSGIKFSPNESKEENEADRLIGTYIYGNDIIKPMLAMSDGGGIYSWHCFNPDDSPNNSNPDPDKMNRILSNTIEYSVGNNLGTNSNNNPGEYDAPGIYLDELACDIEIDGNNISNSASGILVQVGRGYKITSNTIQYCKEFDIKVEHGGCILNGGVLNNDNYIGWTYAHENDPTGSYDGYYWNNEHKVLLDGSDYIYLKMGDYDISNNNIYSPDPLIASSGFYNFIFGTWREVNENTLYDLTGYGDPISINLADNVSIEDVKLHIYSADVTHNSGISRVGRCKYTEVLDATNMLNKLSKIILSINRDGKKVE